MPQGVWNTDCHIFSAGYAVLITINF
jgi:hypothetical protein